VTFVRCSDCGISDCQLLDPLHRGLELEDCVRCRVANNTIADRRSQPTMRHAIRVLGRSRDNLVTGNILSGATDKLLDNSGDTSARQPAASMMASDRRLSQTGVISKCHSWLLS